jgi:hypothetical protein
LAENASITDKIKNKSLKDAQNKATAVKKIEEKILKKAEHKETIAFKPIENIWGDVGSTIASFH